MTKQDTKIWISIGYNAAGNRIHLSVQTHDSVLSSNSRHRILIENFENFDECSLIPLQRGLWEENKKYMNLISNFRD